LCGGTASAPEATIREKSEQNEANAHESGAYIWPVDLRDRHCDLAARRLEDIKGMEIYAHVDFQIQLQKEIDILRSRISKHFDTNTDKDAD
jgi:hypothetical protein